MKWASLDRLAMAILTTVGEVQLRKRLPTVRDGSC